jgi:hypothetical protein
MKLRETTPLWAEKFPLTRYFTCSHNCMYFDLLMFSVFSMSVLEKLDELGWIIDHQCWIDGIYSQTRVCSSHSVHVNDESSQHCCCVMHHFKLSAELFAICEEFLMDSQFQKITQNQSEAKNRV